MEVTVPDGAGPNEVTFGGDEFLVVCTWLAKRNERRR
jgi:hypothetical protein